MRSCSQKRSALLAVLFYIACMLAVTLYASAQGTSVAPAPSDGPSETIAGGSSSVSGESGGDDDDEDDSSGSCHDHYDCCKCRYRWEDTYDKCTKYYKEVKYYCEPYHDYTKQCYDCLGDCPSSSSGGGGGGGNCHDYCDDACKWEDDCRKWVRKYHKECLNISQCDCRCEYPDDGC